MTPDDYINYVLNLHQSTSSLLVAQSLINQLRPSITQWAGVHLLSIAPSGSIAKGTAIKDCSDVDIFISVSYNARESLEEVYNTLYNKFNYTGLNPIKQNVSLGLVMNGWKVDVVPAKKHAGFINEHSLWSHKKKTWHTTNIQAHVNYVVSKQRLNEIRAIKIWRKLHSLEFPSFLLEVVVINSLSSCLIGNTANNIQTVFTYIRDSLPTANILDPTKPSNILSDELEDYEKTALSIAAGNALNATNWNQIIW